MDEQPLDPTDMSDERNTSYPILADSMDAFVFDPSRPPETMTDRELLMELVIQHRSIGAMLAEFQKVGPAGMMKMILTGSNGKG